jgi:hypothetical protein
MVMENVNLKQQLESFDKGIIINSEGNQNDCYNFYDWFCKDSSLMNKAIKLFKQVKIFLRHHPEIDQEKTYVFFKNNCPMLGNLYDDFRICDIETGDVIFTVTPKSGHRTEKPAQLWGKQNKFEGPIKEADTYLGLFK